MVIDKEKETRKKKRNFPLNLLGKNLFGPLSYHLNHLFPWVERLNAISLSLSKHNRGTT